MLVRLELTHDKMFFWLFFSFFSHNFIILCTSRATSRAIYGSYTVELVELLELFVSASRVAHEFYSKK